MNARGSTVPANLRAEAERWLDRLEECVMALQTNAAQLPDRDAQMLAEASADTINTLIFARGVLAGDVRLGERPNSRWVPVKQPGRDLAVLVHAHGDRLGGTPWDLVELAKASLPDEQRRPFLLMIGDVLASVFTNLTQAVWNDYPEYAPQGWKAD
jgi:hypothetical protein